MEARALSKLPALINDQESDPSREEIRPVSKDKLRKKKKGKEI